ncbi:MAG TPA: prepilin-type N-terminal cleavage/methylation domain-containing protein [Terracidiphilus sp.]|jgi:type IV pilus assembly protein PilA
MKSKLSLCNTRIGRKYCSARDNGFTLMELLIVMAIIAILMLIAIPTVGSLKKKANDLSAIQSVHTILNAENMYESTYPTNGFACSLTALGGDPKSGAPSATSSQLIQPDLASGLKSGYIFNITNCTKINAGGTDRITGYSVTAIPQTVGSTGDRAFCSDQSGIIKFDPAGGTNCSQTLGQ